MELETRYVRTSDGYNVAFYTIGSGPVLIVLSPTIGNTIGYETGIEWIFAVRGG